MTDSNTSVSKRHAIKTKREFFQLDSKKPLIGRFIGSVPGKFGDLMIFNNLNNDEQTTIPKYTALQDVPFEEGMIYEINYLGKEKTKQDVDFHNFTVYMIED